MSAFEFRVDAKEFITSEFITSEDKRNQDEIQEMLDMQMFETLRKEYSTSEDIDILNMLEGELLMTGTIGENLHEEECRTTFYQVNVKVLCKFGKKCKYLAKGICSFGKH